MHLLVWPPSDRSIRCVVLHRRTNTLLLLSHNYEHFPCTTRCTPPTAMPLFTGYRSWTPHFSLWAVCLGRGVPLVLVQAVHFHDFAVGGKDVSHGAIDGLPLVAAQVVVTEVGVEEVGAVVFAAYPTNGIAGVFGALPRSVIRLWASALLSNLRILHSILSINYSHIMYI